MRFIFVHKVTHENILTAKITQMVTCAMFSIPDQKSLRLVKLFVEEVVSMFGVPKTLLSDRKLTYSHF